MTDRRATPRLLALLLASAVLPACAPTMVPFTQEIRDGHDLTNDDVRALQFYVSHDVTLRRELETRGRVIEGGELQLHAGKTIEEVVIQEKTPGVAVAIDNGAISISFEEGSALQFSLRHSAPQPLRLDPVSPGGFASPPDPFPGQPGPRLLDDEPILEDGTGRYWLDGDEDAFVTFRGRQWELVDQSYRAHLVIPAESLEEVVEERTTLGGRRVGKSQHLPLISY
ncbi:MAG: DNA-directed RNA polymerase [Polyangiaceae bacterium]